MPGGQDRPGSEQPRVAAVIPIESARKGLIFDNEIENVPDPRPLIMGVLDLNSTATLYGESGSGKSFVALDWALSVVTGQAWHDHIISAPGRVLYVVGEGLTGTRQRFQAWMIQHRRATVNGMAWGEWAPSILTRDGRDELMRWVDQAEPVLTILDTLARHIPGSEENSFEVMSGAVEILDEIRVRTGGCALAVHHTGKERERGARGHSALKAAMDTEIECLKDTKGPKLLVRKQKNHEDGHTLGSFRWKNVGQSLILIPAGTASKNQDLCLGVLAAADTPLDYVTWRDRSVASGVPEGSFHRVRESLIDRAMITVEGGGKGWHRLL